MMASLSFTHLSSLPRWHNNCPVYSTQILVLCQDVKSQNKWGLAAVSKTKLVEPSAAEQIEDKAVTKRRTSKISKQATTLTRKKAVVDTPEESSELISSEEEMTVSEGLEDSNKKQRRTRKKAASSLTTTKEEKTKKVRRRRKSTLEVAEDKTSETELLDSEDSTLFAISDQESDEDLDLGKDKGEDISYTYGWPPLVCCFGAAQHAFVPSGRPANRLVDYEIHERMGDALWAPEKYVRAPGGSVGSVAIALASLGEDSLLKSDINVDVLKEANMLYINTHSLLEHNMRSTALQAIKISKRFGGLVFYDVNLPLPLWHSDEETKLFIQQVWELADFIEVTKQELEFLCGIMPSEEFDTKNNSKSKFIHYEPDIIAPLWHENLKVLFVTNGTSKIHYYTKEHNGAVHGMEDPPITPFSRDMSASGDGIVAGLMRMLTVQPDLRTDTDYLEHSIKYAIDCGVIDQWAVARTRGFPPRDDEEEEVSPDINGIRSIAEREYRTMQLAS
ncbi:fructokinase-like 2, chloroplastic isoform X2 [Rhodamnia argentea]|uniref:Fructokinase-like 2, chloroplastic isoform X2 n=1 Tax=Rhodamnia argentea TaxID=178133 RepID=A0ABM3HI35_9MYRT|nr:fructokinase-like 2, chloroplastic isoform X2 [Rhodamnia argentea]